MVIPKCEDTLQYNMINSRPICISCPSKHTCKSQLSRKFVDEELIILPRPKKHDQDFYPTVNDLHNRIHLALRDLQNGSILSVEV